MRKLTLTLAIAWLSLAFGTAAYASDFTMAEKKLPHGFVQIYDFGDMKLHAYQTNDLMSDGSFILETGQNLVAIESPAFDANIAEWQEYAAGLNKPLTDILISYHPAGGKWYGEAKSQATEAAQKAISVGATKSLTESLGKAFGDGFSTDIPAIDHIIKAGPNNIGNIQFDIIEAGDGFDVAIPSINVIYTHMLGADTHSILAGQEHIDAVLASLEAMKAKNYRLILSSHHKPETQADVDTKIAYIKKVREMAAQSKNREDFVSKVKEAYPGYLGQNYLDMTAGYLFNE